MRVLFLQQQPCVRALKYAAALQAERPGVRLAFAFRGRTLSELYGSGDEPFERWYRLDDVDRDLERAVADFRPDVIHSHNLPDSLTVAALDRVDGGVPVVHDVHDLQSLRRTPYEDGFPEPRDPLSLERRAIEESSAVITVSDELVAEIRARYRVPADVLTFPNYALKRDLPAALPGSRRRGNGTLRVVYQGTLATNNGHYDLRRIFARLATAVELDVYPNRPVDGYTRLGIRLRSKLPTRDLLAALVRYDLGWAGFNTELNRAHLDTVLPNKVFEYLGCGLPVLALRHRALARFLEERGLGVVLDHLDDLDARLDELELEPLRRRVATARFDFTAEAQIGRVVELYESVTG